MFSALVAKCIKQSEHPLKNMSTENSNSTCMSHCKVSNPPFSAPVAKCIKQFARPLQHAKNIQNFPTCMSIAKQCRTYSAHSLQNAHKQFARPLQSVKSTIQSARCKVHKNNLHAHCNTPKAFKISYVHVHCKSVKPIQRTYCKVHKNNPHANKATPAANHFESIQSAHCIVPHFFWRTHCKVHTMSTKDSQFTLLQHATKFKFFLRACPIPLQSAISIIQRARCKVRNNNSHVRCNTPTSKHSYVHVHCKSTTSIQCTYCNTLDSIHTCTYVFSTQHI